MDVDALLATVRTPTPDEMAARRELARRFTVVLLCRGSVVIEDEAEDDRIQLEHLQHLTKLQLLGKLVMNGPVLADHEVRGISVYATDPDEARVLAEADPRVVAGCLRVDVLPWIAVPWRADGL